MSKHSGLGRGLESLLSSSESQYETAIPKDPEGAVEVPVESIRPNPYQPRKTFDKEKLKELSESIKKHGIIQPLIVRKKGLNYELVAGERRLRAAKLAKLQTVPVLVREYDEKQMRELSLVENIQRHDLNPLEEAKAIQELMKQCSYTQAQAAERLGRSRAAVANLLRMLNLPEELQAMIADEKVTAGQMRPLSALTDREQQLKIGRALAENGWSARTVEEVVKTIKEGKNLEVLNERIVILDKNGKPVKDPSSAKDKNGKKKKSEADIHYKQFEENLIEALGTKVRIVSKNDNVGKIEIDYYSLDDLDRICELLQGKNDSSSIDTAPWLKTKFPV
ncbi:ParB/RepB/Spo0J family partition protein [Succiniclasticum ruminis]|uniref:Chromosome segregation DNA-binding protein n=1 Tax=Succiniclasticum ruminis DSM 9236 TaxID=1123323 RepID=A0A1I2CWS0_9FIRM|nr:ParB/RepB/Spo0J family partition protein [Succiniclasticum ruminis]SFE72751.1 chromosome segregation DNA-binding protein [Succiniclasticum ruminis DSM 9236]